MMRLRVWNRDFEEIGTIERENVGLLLDMGKNLQERHGAYFRLELSDTPKEGQTDGTD
jgi:hypothetical protein